MAPLKNKRLANDFILGGSKNYLKERNFKPPPLVYTTDFFSKPFR